jgi:hypothetical protein
VFGNQQYACCIAVETMDETRPIAEAIRHRSEDAIEVALRARAALHRDTERLVQHQHMVILEQDRVFDQLAICF